MIAVAVVALLLWSWVVTGMTPFAAGTTVAVLSTGLVAMLAGARWWRRPDTRHLSVRDLLPWAVVAAVLLVWQLLAFVQSPRDEHPTISSLTNAALDGRPLRALAFAGWTVGAAWLARR